jgi:hypothetical protein
LKNLLTITEEDISEGLTNLTCISISYDSNFVTIQDSISSWSSLFRYSSASITPGITFSSRISLLKSVKFCGIINGSVNLIVTRPEYVIFLILADRSVAILN